MGDSDCDSVAKPQQRTQVQASGRSGPVLLCYMDRQAVTGMTTQPAVAPRLSTGLNLALIGVLRPTIKRGIIIPYLFLRKRCYQAKCDPKSNRQHDHIMR
ncbi:hypothetical protein MHYP_G00337380 [Metynnis hypsauchen]